METERWQETAQRALSSTADMAMYFIYLLSGLMLRCKARRVPQGQAGELIFYVVNEGAIIRSLQASGRTHGHPLRESRPREDPRPCTQQSPAHWTRW